METTPDNGLPAFKFVVRNPHASLSENLEGGFQPFICGQILHIARLATRLAKHEMEWVLRICVDIPQQIQKPCLAMEQLIAKHCLRICFYGVSV